MFQRYAEITQRISLSQRPANPIFELRGKDQIKHTKKIQELESIYWISLSQRPVIVNSKPFYALRGEDQIQHPHQIEEFQCPHQNHRRLEEKAMVGISSEGED